MCCSQADLYNIFNFVQEKLAEEIGKFSRGIEVGIGEDLLLNSRLLVMPTMPKVVCMWCFQRSLCWNRWYWLNEQEMLLAFSLHHRLCLVRPEEIHCLSAFLHSLFADLNWSLILPYQGSHFCNGALVWVFGVCMSMKECRNSFKCSAERLVWVALR